MSNRRRAVALYVLGLGIIGGAFAAGRALDFERRPEQFAALEIDSELVPLRELPFAVGTTLQGDQKRAVDAVAEMAFAGAMTTVESVERRQYNAVMCGRSAFTPADREVWLVWLKGPFRTFAPTVPQGVMIEGLATLPQNLTDQAFVVDAGDYTVYHSFQEWPLPRDPKANCPTP
jgi:hypothetical protein